MHRAPSLDILKLPRPRPGHFSHFCCYTQKGREVRKDGAVEAKTQAKKSRTGSISFYLFFSLKFPVE